MTREAAIRLMVLSCEGSRRFAEQSGYKVPVGYAMVIVEAFEALGVTSEELSDACDWVISDYDKAG